MFNYGLKSLELSKTNVKSSLWKELFENEKLVEEIAKQGKISYKFSKQQNRYIANNSAFEINWENKKWIICNSSVGGSEVFESLYNPDVHDRMISFKMVKNGKWVFSLYTTHDDFDVSLIAKKYGGGGA